MHCCYSYVSLIYKSICLCDCFIVSFVNNEDIAWLHKLRVVNVTEEHFIQRQPPEEILPLIDIRHLRGIYR